jgi:DNA-binding HxlR family transcriptional regulator
MTPHPSATLFDLISGMIRTQTIAAIAELGVADAIAAGTTRTSELAREVGADPDALQRMLRLLEADGLVAQDAPGVWSLTDVGELLREDVDGSQRHLARLFAAEVYDAWAGATESLRTGEAAFPGRFGVPFFDWLQQHPDGARRFDQAMAGTAALRLRPLLERDWTGISTVVDVGGGNGALLEALLERVPQLEGVCFDLAEVAQRAAVRIEATSVAGRLRARAGSFFDEVPAGDAYILAQVLHDWSDEDSVRILAACRRGAGEHARLFVLEQVVPDGDRPSPVKLLDLNMLILLGGRERTLAEFEVVLAAGGWRLDARRDGPRSTLLEAVPIS